MPILTRISERFRKLTLDEILQHFFMLCRFVFMAIVGFSINFGLTVLLHEKVGWSEQAAFACGLATVFVFNFFVFRRFVFRATTGNKRSQLLRFFWMSVVFRSSEFGAFWVVLESFNIDYRIAVIAILGISMLSKFVIYRLFVFRDK